eukprot:c52508_g1_i1 orf=73-240(-)
MFSCFPSLLLHGSRAFLTMIPYQMEHALLEEAWLHETWLWKKHGFTNTKVDIGVL